MLEPRHGRRVASVPDDALARLRPRGQEVPGHAQVDVEGLLRGGVALVAGEHLWRELTRGNDKENV